MNNQETNVTLYIGTHNKTGLKYFGKTGKYFTQKELQKYYHGSGKYWKKHLKKHGDDVTMEIYGIYKKSEVEEIALKFSKDNNIVRALNESGDRKGRKVWANEKPENGLDGNVKGNKHAKETKKKISKIMQNKTPEEKNKIKEKIQNFYKNLSEKEYKELGQKISYSLKNSEKFKKTHKEATKIMNEVIQNNGRTIRQTAEEKRQKTNIKKYGNSGGNIEKLQNAMKSKDIIEDELTLKQIQTKKAMKTREEKGINKVIGEKTKQKRLLKDSNGKNSYERMADKMICRFQIMKDDKVYNECHLTIVEIETILNNKTISGRIRRENCMKRGRLKGMWIRKIV